MIAGELIEARYGPADVELNRQLVDYAELHPLIFITIAFVIAYLLWKFH